MCGIAGFIGFENNMELAHKANEIQKHRGPDHQNVWGDGYITFAHQRLSIIDLSDAANQPFHKNDLVIIFNGEIYNYEELRRKLQDQNQVEFTTTSDTEVVLEMYNHYGVECLSLFLGMFAFAIYDKKSEVLFVARDHFGIKPLFYTQMNEAFAFSSELKVLMILPHFKKVVNPKALVSSLNYLWISGNDTIFDNCYKLPPAHYLVYTKEIGISLFKYWEINDSGNQIVSTEAAIAADVADTIELSVRRHMVADVPVSSFLSGGLDSSLISVIAKSFNDSLSTYTIGTSSKDYKVERGPVDEKYAKLVAAAYNLENHVIKINTSIIDDLPLLVRMLDEPIGDPAAIITYLVCKAARNKGAKVLLSGLGADEIFFGYRRQKATLLALKFNRLPKFLKYITTHFVGSIPVKIRGKGFKIGRWAKRFIGFTTMPVDEAYMRSYSYYDTAQLKKLLKAEYWPAIDSIKNEHEQLFNSKFKTDIVNRICYTDINMFMLGLNLTYTDRASMAASVEVRVPFIDKLVITQAMQIPGSLKIKGGKSKYILKKAAERTLPGNIIYRSKASFGVPIRSWISNDLKCMVNELLSQENITKRGFFNFEFVERLINNDRNGIEDNAYQIYQLLTFELWCKEYLDK